MLVVDVVRCDRPSGQAGMVPRSQCITPGCPRSVKAQGRCNACYCRWYSSPEFTPAPRREVVPDPDPECRWCGPYPHRPRSADVICPTCGLDAAEVRYAERIMADSDAVYRQEWREFQANRAKGGP